MQVRIDSFDQGFLDDSASKINNEISKIGLPSDVDYSVKTVTAGGPAMILVYADDSKSMETLAREASAIADKFQDSNKGIDTVNLSPESEFKIVIELDSSKLAEHGLDYRFVKNTI